METVKRKIGFVKLESISNSFNFDDLIIALEAVKALSNERRKFLYGDNKFCRLSSVTKHQGNSKIQLLFKGGKHKDRRPLINPENENERDNPKGRREGEREQTHVIIKLTTNGILLVHEMGLDVLGIGTMIKYMNLKFEEVGQQIILKHTILTTDNFIEQIDRLSRIMETEITIETRLLGTPFFNLTNLLDAKDRSKIIVKAKRKKDIKNFVRSVYTLISNGSEDIKDVKIKGRTDDNIEVEYATDFLKKKEVISVSRNDDGVLNSVEIFREMNVILLKYQ